MQTKDGKVQGGLACVCDSLPACNARIDENVEVLGEGVGVTVTPSSQNKRKGKGQEKGTRESKSRRR